MFLGYGFSSHHLCMLRHDSPCRYLKLPNNSQNLKKGFHIQTPFQNERSASGSFEFRIDFL